MQIKIELPPEAIKITFLNAIQEVEALREFYTMYRDTWTKSKLAFEQQYATALEINDAIEKILDSEEPENEYLHIKESNVGESKFDDIIELHIRRDDQSVRVSYSMKKVFSTKTIRKRVIKNINIISKKKSFFVLYYQILLLFLKGILLKSLSL